MLKWEGGTHKASRKSSLGILKDSLCLRNYRYNARSVVSVQDLVYVGVKLYEDNLRTD